jgi:DNA-binding HxlR family transcriptional regulator
MGEGVARSYGQYCGLARAAEVIGERWALLVIRDLMLGPQRFGELMAGLPGAPKTVIATRLKELEDAGIVQRTVLARPANGVAYALTDRGQQLGPALSVLGAWGSQLLTDEPRPGDALTAAPVIHSLRITFDPAAAAGTRLRATLLGQGWIVHVQIRDGQLTATRAAPGQLSDTSTRGDLEVDLRFAFNALISGAITVDRAIDEGRVTLVHGSHRTLRQFLAMFRTTTGAAHQSAPETGPAAGPC